MIFLSKMVQMKMGESYRLEREMMSHTHHLKSFQMTDRLFQSFGDGFIRVPRTVIFGVRRARAA